MIKRKEVSDPTSCLNRATDDEPVFVLLGRDVSAPTTIKYWIADRISQGKNVRSDPEIRDAELMADYMEGWRRDR
jgi:hypothetical protein